MRIVPPFICLIACVTSTLALAMPDSDDLPNGSKPVSAPNSSDALTLAPKTQQLAGIKTQPLEAAEQQPEFTAYGTVLSLEPLLQLRQQYLAARTQQDSAKAKYTETDLNLSRTQNLHAQDIVSTRRLQEQQALWQADKANLAASGYQQQAILAASRLEWGNTLTEWFIQTQGKAAEQFLNNGAQLLQITLPANVHLDPAVRNVYVDERGQRGNAIRAALISASPRIDPVSQGERYFFKTEGRRIPFGTHVNVWITSDTQQTAGVFVPKSALVWHLGQAFIFIRTADDKFSRRALPQYTPGSHGYFVTGPLKAGEEIVISGAQTLLSQELKNLIPSEDDD
ncbi:MAG: efflux RND transporter periplasmic adaptor subunit [Methylomonas sp.]